MGDPLEMQYILLGGCHMGHTMPPQMAPRCVLMVSKGVPWFAMQYAMECPGPGGAFHGVFHGINVCSMVL